MVKVKRDKRGRFLRGVKHSNRRKKRRRRRRRSRKSRKRRSRRRRRKEVEISGGKAKKRCAAIPHSLVVEARRKLKKK